VGLPICEALWIDAEEVVREHATIRDRITVGQGLPYLGLEPKQVLEEQPAHGTTWERLVPRRRPH
jgi:hypothetical protein